MMTSGSNDRRDDGAPATKSPLFPSLRLTASAAIMIVAAGAGALATVKMSAEAAPLAPIVISDGGTLDAHGLVYEVSGSADVGLPQPVPSQNETAPALAEVTSAETPRPPEGELVATENVLPPSDPTLPVPAAASPTEPPIVEVQNPPVPAASLPEAAQAAAADPQPPVPAVDDFPKVGGAAETKAPPSDAKPATKPAAATSASGQSAKPVPTTPTADAGPDVYYDSELNVPTGPIANAVGPRKLNPVMEPAQKFIVARETAGPDDFEALLVGASRALKLGRYESAMEMYNSLYKKNPRDPRVLMGRAVAQQNAGLGDSAIMSYEELLAIDPKNTDAVINMMGLVRQQYPETALRRLMELQAKNPNNAGIAAQIGITSADLGEHDEALRYLGIAASLEPQNAQHLFNMAIVADRKGDKNTAIRHYERALELDVSASASARASLPRESIHDRLAILRNR